MRDRTRTTGRCFLSSAVFPVAQEGPASLTQQTALQVHRPKVPRQIQKSTQHVFTGECVFLILPDQNVQFLLKKGKIYDIFKHLYNIIFNDLYDVKKNGFHVNIDNILNQNYFTASS